MNTCLFSKFADSGWYVVREDYSLELLELFSKTPHPAMSLNSSMNQLSIQGIDEIISSHAIIEQYRNLVNTASFPISILLIDIHGLKIQQSLYGYETGDHTVKRLLWNLIQISQANQSLVRLNEESFLFFLPHTTPDKRRRIADHIYSLSGTDRLVDGSIPVNVAIGQCTILSERENFLAYLNKVAEECFQQQFLIENTTRYSILQGMFVPFSRFWPGILAHTDRVRNMCSQFARYLGMNRKEINDLELLALLHDIGMIGLPERIVKGTKPLSEIERKQMQNHPVTGLNMILEIPELCFLGEYVLAHHERWDGQGYPDGRKRQEIPYLNRLFYIIDLFDILIHDRSYSAAVSREQALEILEKEKGKALDPSLCDKFVSWMKEKINDSSATP